MTNDEHDALTAVTLKLLDRVIAKLTKLRDTLAKGKIYGAFDCVYDALADLAIVKNRVSSLSAGKQDVIKVQATKPSKPVPVDDEPPSC